MIGIYRITHLTTGRHYVGQSQDIQRRWKQHQRRTNSHISLALEKYGLEAFELVVLQECKVEELDRFEEFWVAKLEAFTKGFNLSAGGKQAKRGPQTLERQRAVAKAKWDSKTSEELAVWAAKHGAAARADSRRQASGATGKRNWADPNIRERMLKGIAAQARTPEARQLRSENLQRAWADPVARKQRVEKLCGVRGPNSKNQRKDTFLFVHDDGREIEATLWEMAYLHKALSRSGAQDLSTGRYKTSNGWRIRTKLTGSAIPA